MSDKQIYIENATSIHAMPLNHDDVIVVRIEVPRKMPPTVKETYLQHISKGLGKTFPDNKIVILHDNTQMYTVSESTFNVLEKELDNVEYDVFLNGKKITEYSDFTPKK